MKRFLCMLLMCLLTLPAMAEGLEVLEVTDASPAETTTVTVSRAEVMHGGLLLVNSRHARPADFDDSGILSISSQARDSGLGSFWDSSSCRLHPTAVNALLLLLTDARQAGYTSYVLQSGYCYRSYEEQDRLFRQQLDGYRARYPQETEDQLIARAAKSVNLPGTSEFNTGLSFCPYLYSRSNSAYYRTTPFYDTPDGRWLYENSWRYGFVFRFSVAGYPTADATDKSAATGMGMKLNCYRYVGQGHAAVMHHLDLCLEEYVAYLAEHPHIAVYEDGVKRYEITWQYVGDPGPEFTVNVLRQPEGCTMTLDNLGGLITVYTY